jgi:hypothetical protein
MKDDQEQVGSTDHGEISFTRLRTLPWWTAAVALALVILGTVITLAWLLEVAGTDANRRLEAIKRGFTIGLAGGGLLALFVALRRQWLQERTQAYAEHVAVDNARRSDRVAASSEHDAAERRVTELYVKAAEQLGSSKAPVRLAGMFALDPAPPSRGTTRFAHRI